MRPVRDTARIITNPLIDSKSAISLVYPNAIAKCFANWITGRRAENEKTRFYISRAELRDELSFTGVIPRA